MINCTVQLYTMNTQFNTIFKPVIFSRAVSAWWEIACLWNSESFRLGFKVLFGRSARKRTARHIQTTFKMHCDPITQTTCRGGLGHTWPLSFCGVNVNVSWCFSKKDVTRKYVFSAGCHGCFGGGTWKMERGKSVRGYANVRNSIHKLVLPVIRNSWNSL